MTTRYPAERNRRERAAPGTAASPQTQQHLFRGPRYLFGGLRVYLAAASTSRKTEAVMRKIIESTLVSADGVVGSPPLWAMGYRDEEVTRDALERLSGSDAMLMGRGTYELFAATWPGQTDDFARRINAIRKYVFSSTLTSADWSNSTIVRGDVLAEVTRIKEQDGRDLALFGHGRLARTLLDSGLIDELRLSIHPVLAGAGLPQFSNGHKTPLTLVAAKPFTTGAVVLSYRTAGA